MNAPYFLQMSEAERKSLHRQTRKAKNLKDADNIDAIHDSLDGLQPNFAFLIEMPDEYDASKIKLISPLEIPIDVLVIRKRGNTVQSEPIEHVRDGEGIRRIVAALQTSKILKPLLEGATELMRTLNSAYESAAPEIATILDALYAFGPILARGTAETAQLHRSLSR